MSELTDSQAGSLATTILIVCGSIYVLFVSCMIRFIIFGVT